MDPSNNSPKNVLSPDVEIKGNIKFTGELTLEGKLEGEINADGTLFVGENGVINGNINVNNVIVRGKINGNVIAKEKIEIKSKAELFGDIRAARLSIEEGVTFVGRAEINPNKIAASTGNGRMNEPVKGPEVLKSVSAGR